MNCCSNKFYQSLTSDVTDSRRKKILKRTELSQTQPVPKTTKKN